MFDLIIKEAASRFGLGDKGGMLVQMLVAYMTNKNTGGLAGFMDMFKSKGLGDLASSWLGGGANAKAISGPQIESVLGGSGGLLGSLASKTGLGGSVITSAMGYLLPSIVGKLTPGGSIPTSLSADVLGFADQGKNLLGGMLGTGAAAAAGATKAVGNIAGHAAGAATDTAKAAGGGLMKWLPWVIAAAVAAWLLSQCTGTDVTKKAADAAKSTATATADAAKATASATADAAKTAAATTTAAATDAAKAAADAAKAAATATTTAAASGATMVLNYLDKAPEAVAGSPSAKFYFDSGKVDLPADYAALLKPVVDYVKANAGTKAALSGFHDPTGDKAQNEELAKNRAKMVREELRKAGFGEDQILMVKPASTTGTGDLKEARRVELTVVK